MIEKIAANLNVILAFGLILLSGYLGGRAANLVKLPKVTGYIIAGILLEPSFLGVLPERLLVHSTVISNFALCIITYAIGGSLNFRKIKRLGNSIWVMTVFESIVTFLFIAVGMYLLMPFLNSLSGLNLNPVYFLPLAVLAASLGAPTDPTPTLAVKEEYKASGPVTTTILGIGAFDDAMGIVIFSLAIALGSIFLGSTGAGFVKSVVTPLGQIIASIGLGAVFAGLLLLMSRKVKDAGVLVVMIMGALFCCFGMAQALGLDELLTTMTLGCCVVNFAGDKERFFMSIREYFEEMVFVVFFVIAGAQLQLDVLIGSLWVVLVFAVLRTAGKFLGAGTGGMVSRAEPNVRKYTAFGLIPQGGVVVGLALVVKQDSVFDPISPLLINMIIGTTVLFEFIGPLLTEYALKKTGESRSE
ncbi:MAG: cation:proton antiporter [Candidatus Omnitrophica bacterium]|nr:cation:proton antiporter [Candidatus Omnitrophota bacterium]